MPDPGRILGIDYGSRRVGLAVSDPLRVISQGAGTLDTGPLLLARLAGIVQERDVTLIVVGMPYAPDGGISAKGKEIEAFCAQLRAVVPVPVETWDESFTSVDAQRAFLAGGMKRKKRREKGRVDEMAARILLQGFLESHQER